METRGGELMTPDRMKEIKEQTNTIERVLINYSDNPGGPMRFLINAVRELSAAPCESDRLLERVVKIFDGVAVWKSRGVEEYYALMKPIIEEIRGRK